MEQNKTKKAQNSGARYKVVSGVAYEETGRDQIYWFINTVTNLPGHTATLFPLFDPIFVTPFSVYSKDWRRWCAVDQDQSICTYCVLFLLCTFIQIPLDLAESSRSVLETRRILLPSNSNDAARFFTATADRSSCIFQRRLFLFPFVMSLPTSVFQLWCDLPLLLSIRNSRLPKGRISFWNRLP